MMRQVWMYVVIALLAAPALAETDARPMATIEPADGDRIVFIGDSITYQCAWTQYVENYFYTRFPTTRLHIHNVAVGGDRGDTVLKRFDKTIATIEPAPKYAFVMLGMNDGRYFAPFHQGKFNDYCANMVKLIERLEERGTKVIAIGPPYFDRRMNERAAPDYNVVLAAYGAWLRETAHDRGHAYVDVNGPMARITARGRADDPAFTLVPDGIHPLALGQFVMAVEVLEQMGMPRVVSAVDLAHGGSGWSAEVENGRVEQIEALADGVAFTLHAEALPWTPPGTDHVLGEARDGYALTGASARLNRETLRVRGLSESGRYTLTIDGEPVGEYDRDDLIAGIELQDNERTPQHRQAAALAAANAKRNFNHVGQYVKAWLMHGYHEKDRLYVTDPANAEKPDFAQRKAEYDAWYDANEKHKWNAHRLAREGEAAIYTMNAPVPRRYELRRVDK